MKYLYLLIHIHLWSLGSFEKISLLDIPTYVKKDMVEFLEETDKNFGLKTLLNNQCTEPPLHCPNQNITFWLYTRSNPDSPIEITSHSNENFHHPDYGLQHPWKIIIHGYTMSKDRIPNPQLQKAFFQKGQYNLISVDYEPIARDKCYMAAVHNVPLISKCTAEMLENFLNRNKVSLNSVHVIGFSLGAHIAGLMHKYMGNNKKPARVTGLDPAFPLFDGSINEIISENSGHFVDIIHTNALFKGKLEKLGHVDFYVNGGFNQPGCTEDKTKTRSTCSHDRAPLYYAESINSQTGFWGISCSKTKYYTVGCSGSEDEAVLMGEYIPLTARGTYYVDTMSNPPYALGRTAKGDSKIALSVGKFISEQ